LREIFPPSFWKEMHAKYADFEEGRWRWGLQSLWHVGLFMALEPGDVQGERFERARETYNVWFAKRARCGTTLAGFQKALAELPAEFLAAVRGALQKYWRERLGGPRKIGNWRAFGLDGSKEDLTRTAAQEAHYGLATKGPGAPQAQVVAAVTLGEHALWDWSLGSALDSERALALEVIRRLPEDALSVLDAGFIGYEWARQMQAAQRFFLARVGGNVRLWVESIPGAEWKDGQVWLWPENRAEAPPIVLRLICLAEPKRGKGGRKRGRHQPRQELWLLTNVLDERALPRELARRFYRWRWPASEGTFRSWKRTLDAAKLHNRTPVRAQREMELSLCALAILEALASGARKGQGGRRKKRQARRPASVAGARRVWRKAVRAVAAGKATNWFRASIGAAVEDGYRRRRPKVRRRWPERKEHRWPKKPVFRRLPKWRKELGLLRLEEQNRAAC